MDFKFLKEKKIRIALILLGLYLMWGIITAIIAGGYAYPSIKLFAGSKGSQLGIGWTGKGINLKAGDIKIEELLFGHFGGINCDLPCLGLKHETDYIQLRGGSFLVVCRCIGLLEYREYYVPNILMQN